MFIENPCLVRHCRNNALSTFDKDGNLTEEKSYCLDHIPDPGKIKQDIYNYIATHEKSVGLCANGLLFQNIDFSNKEFYGCNFHRCTFINIHSENVKTHMCIFDFAVFNDCSFIKSNSMFTSFSGSTFFHTLFTSSDMIQDNFNGIKAYQSSFDDSDLFNSRFIMANLVDTSMQNCNLKHTLFYNSERTNVSFKMSNTREALFDLRGSALARGETDKKSSDKPHMGMSYILLLFS